LALRQQKRLPAYFNVDRFSVTVESARDGDGKMASRAHAAVEMTVAGQKIRNVGTGNGPVNALDAALRMDLGKYSSYLADLRLVDYKVRILTSGTEAVTRVTVESADGKGNRWSTVGVSENIVDASFEALTDSIIYKLYRDHAPV
jgi:2-isopropylmalate synthase